VDFVQIRVHLDLHASLVRSLGMPGVTNVRLVPTAEGADRSRWMPDSEWYVSPDGRLKLVLGNPGEVRMGLGVWTEARLFEDGAERTRRHEALLEVVGNRLLPQSCYVRGTRAVSASCWPTSSMAVDSRQSSTRTIGAAGCGPSLGHRPRN
jgi:hypothetical protein